MNNFLKWFFAFITSMLQGFGEIFLGIWESVWYMFLTLRAILHYLRFTVEILGVLEWVLSVVAIIIVVAIYGLIAAMIVLAVRKYLRFRHSIVSNEDLLEEISELQRRVMKLMKEKDEIMAMKVTQMGLPVSGVLTTANGEMVAGGAVAAQWRSSSTGRRSPCTTNGSGWCHSND